MSASLRLKLDVDGGMRPVQAEVNELVVAGWAGRDQAAIAAHISTSLRWKPHVDGGMRPVQAEVNELVVAGWTGRDQAAIAAHISAGLRLKLHVDGGTLPGKTWIARCSCEARVEEGAVYHQAVVSEEVFAR